MRVEGYSNPVGVEGFQGAVTSGVGSCRLSTPKRRVPQDVPTGDVRVGFPWRKRSDGRDVYGVEVGVFQDSSPPRPRG